MSIDDMHAASGSATPDMTLSERVHVLEERTRPKSKGLVDHVKDWGGVASLVIALLYSFPLGLWDRFIVSEKVRTAREISELRAVVEESTIILSDGARALSAIVDPSLRDMVQRALNTRLYIVMSRHKEALGRHIDAFTPPEALVIGYNFQITNQHEAAIDFFRFAKERAEADEVTRLEAVRMEAKLFFLPGNMQDRAKARQLYDAAAAQMHASLTPLNAGTYLTLLSEWGMFELIDGDWMCGQEKIRAVHMTYPQFAPFLNDQGNFLRMIAQRTQPLARRPDQPAEGC
ncbi:hypothetical protein [Pacificispira sp.]|uniref:hypothetical protein n=1 Tax=Pacificispira sp. TaxID=2888761 RepID=UPI003BAAB875